MRRPLLALVALVALPSFTGVARAADPIMPLSDVKAGMHCTALSVIQGTTISSFKADVIDVVLDPSVGAQILIRVSGPAVDDTGIGPGFWTFDLRIARRIGLGEHRALDFSAEGFNLLNHLNMATVNNVVGSISGPFNLHGRDDRNPSQPLGFTSAFDSRRIQLGVRFSF